MSHESKSVFCVLLMQRYNKHAVPANPFSERRVFHYEIKR